MSHDLARLREQARQWLADDPDPVTRAELQDLLARAGDDAAAVADLADRFAGPLEFGTAGLRGAMGAGPHRMNRVSVGRAAAGLAHWLVRRGGGRVVVGYDARTDSDQFARDTAEIMTGAGLPAMVLPRPLPTPVLAFAIRRLGAAAGVMVTASHNPATDNGYKVYVGDGTQIVPPDDADIARCIEAVGLLRDVPRDDSWTTLDDDVVVDYVTTAAALVPPHAPRDLTIVSTAMHGVGGEVLARVLTTTGFGPPLAVPAQQQPDPAFPTVEFPNPEEPGALDLALELAAENDADVVLANDPDADRCAVAVPGADGGWRALTGDEVGALLGQLCASGSSAGTLATSIVSSSRLQSIAAAHGLGFVSTLTGFKWIGRVPGLVFGYEEAIGYCVDPRHVADKDGITAALRVAQLAAQLKAEGRTLLDALDDLDTRYGVHHTSQVSVRGDDLTVLRHRLEHLVTEPPQRLGGLAVSTHEDLGRGVDGLPPTEGVRLWLAGVVDGASTRVIVRPSGTEPKVKAYVEVVVPVTSQRTLSSARAVAAEASAALRADLTEVLSA